MLLFTVVVVAVIVIITNTMDREGREECSRCPVHLAAWLGRRSLAGGLSLAYA